MNLILSWDQHGIFISSTEIFTSQEPWQQFLVPQAADPTMIPAWLSEVSGHLTGHWQCFWDKGFWHLISTEVLPEWPWTTDLVDLLPYLPYLWPKPEWPFIHSSGKNQLGRSKHDTKQTQPGNFAPASKLEVLKHLPTKCLPYEKKEGI